MKFTKKTRNNSFPIDENNMTKIPFADINYNIDAGVINKGNVNVQVFEISATYKNVLFGLNAKIRNTIWKTLESGINE